MNIYNNAISIGGERRKVMLKMLRMRDKEGEGGKRDENKQGSKRQRKDKREGMNEGEKLQLTMRIGMKEDVFFNKRR